MTLSFSNLNEIWNLYENIAASEQEQLNEDSKVRVADSPSAFAQRDQRRANVAARGGQFGMLTRQLTKAFGSGSDIKKIDADDAADRRREQTALARSKNPNWKAPEKTQKPPEQRQDQNDAAAKPETVAAAGGKGGTVTAGKQYAATLGGQKGNVTYDASGAKKFTPSASTSAKTLPSKPAGSAMDQWAKANPKLAAAKAERDRTRGTSATTNPLMKDMKSSLPAPAAKPAATSTLKSATDAASKPSAFTPKTPAATSSVGSFKPVNSLQATNAAGSTKAPDSATSFSKTTAATPKPITPNPSASTPAGGYSTKEGDGKLRKDPLFEGVDAYDLVLEYLLDNGHVDTVEEAHYVMMEMPAETIQTIVEGAVGEFADKVASTVGSAVGTVQRAAREIPKYAKQKVDNVAGTYEYARQRADANAPSGAKMSVPTKPSTPRSREFSHGGKSGMTNPGPNFGR